MDILAQLKTIEDIVIHSTCHFLNLIWLRNWKCLQGVDLSLYDLTLLMENKCSDVLEKDINDVFDSIAFSEEQISNEAFQEGLIKGKEDGQIEGYHLGFHRGLELGTEIGFYKGLTRVVLNNLNGITVKRSEKINPLLEKLVQALEDFPKQNSEDVDLLKKVNEIRANIRKLSSLLKLNLSFPVHPKMSF